MVEIEALSECMVSLKAETYLAEQNTEVPKKTTDDLMLRLASVNIKKQVDI